MQTEVSQVQVAFNNNNMKKEEEKLKMLHIYYLLFLFQQPAL